MFYPDLSGEKAAKIIENGQFNQSKIGASGIGLLVWQYSCLTGAYTSFSKDGKWIYDNYQLINVNFCPYLYATMI